jgi:hypothetical protein
LTTRLQFAQACLQAFNPTSDTPAHEQAMVAWMAYENTQATWNPMATTQSEPDATNFNSVGVKNYPNEATGVQGWLDTLNNGDYSTTIVAALLNSNSSASQVAQAVSSSPWGSHPTATLAQVQGAYSTYSNIAIPDGTGGSTTTNATTSAVAGTGTVAEAAVALVNGGAGSITTGATIPGFGAVAVGDIIFNGAGLTADVSNAVTDIIVERSIANASTVTLQLDDPLRQILRSGIFNQGDSLVLDGLPFTLVSFAKASDQLQLTFEATGVYLLRQRTGLTNYNSQTDVTGFAKQLVNEVSGLGFVGYTTALTQENAISIGRGTSSDPTEDSWTCLVRIATTIGWRVWESANTVYFGPDPYWLTHFGTQGVLQEFTDQVQNMDWDYDVGLPFGNLTVTAMTNLWVYNPGTPVTVAQMGVATGIWLVNDMQRDLFNPQATITLMVPMTPPELIASTAGEPTAVSTSVGTGSPASGTPNITATVSPAAIVSRGEAFTVTANVSGAGYGNTPQGTIEFQSSSTLTDGTAATSGDLPGGGAVKLDSTGTASVTVSKGFGPGTYTIIASYSGGAGGPPPSGQWQPIDTSASPISLIVN